MEFLSAGIGIAGLAMQLFGGLGGASVSKQQSQLNAQSAQISGQVSADEGKINEQKKMQVGLEAQRAQLENFRNVQKAQAHNLNTATQQGAQFGSGLAGGQAEAQDQGGVNALGIGQNLEISNNIFGIDADISSKRVQMANLQSQSAQLGGDAATYQGISSLGGALVKAGPTIGSFSQNIFSGFGGGTGTGSAKNG